MVRQDLGSKAGDGSWERWHLSTLAVMQCIEAAILPELVPTTALFNQEARYLPPHIRLAGTDKVPFLLSMFHQCDKIFDAAEQRRIQHVQQLTERIGQHKLKTTRIKQLLAQAVSGVQPPAHVGEALQQVVPQAQAQMLWIQQAQEPHVQLAKWLQQQQQAQQGSQQGRAQQPSAFPQSLAQLNESWLSPALAAGEAARLLFAVSEVQQNPQGGYRRMLDASAANYGVPGIAVALLCIKCQQCFVVSGVQLMFDLYMWQGQLLSSSCQWRVTV
jgi:hypothetical protein